MTNQKEQDIVTKSKSYTQDNHKPMEKDHKYYKTVLDILEVIIENETEGSMRFEFGLCDVTRDMIDEGLLTVEERNIFLHYIQENTSFNKDRNPKQKTMEEIKWDSPYEIRYYLFVNIENELPTESSYYLRENTARENWVLGNINHLKKLVA